MRSSLSHPGSAHKSALGTWQGRSGIVFVVNDGVWPCFSPGVTKTKNGDGCLHMCQCDISILLQEKHTYCWAQTAEWKGWILTAGHKSKPLFSAYHNVQASRFHGNRQRGGKEQAPPRVPFSPAHEFWEYFCHKLWLKSPVSWWVAVRTCADIYAWLNFGYTRLFQVLKAWLLVIADISSAMPWWMWHFNAQFVRRTIILDDNLESTSMQILIFYGFMVLCSWCYTV